MIRLPGRSHSPDNNGNSNFGLGEFGQTMVLRHKEVHHFFLAPFREQPIYSTRAHAFQIDPNTKKNWVPTSKHAVTVSYFYDSTRNVYRIISLDGTKVKATYSAYNTYNSPDILKLLLCLYAMATCRYFFQTLCRSLWTLLEVPFGWLSTT